MTTDTTIDTTIDPTIDPAESSIPTDGRRTRRTGGRRGRRRARGAHMHDDGHHQHAEHDRGGRGGGRHRARRGAVPFAIFSLLDERPMHGYEIITELETRSDGRWRPSAGSIYPTLDRLEGRGLLTSTDVDGKRQFALTDRGRQMLAEIRDAQGDDAAEPWNHSGTGGRGELRRLMSELGGQARQISRFGSSEQRDAATDVLQETKRRLYEILARPATNSDATD
jgi:DNA-binding PadR family transcriptional regulator